MRRLPIIMEYFISSLYFGLFLTRGLFARWVDSERLIHTVVAFAWHIWCGVELFAGLVIFGCLGVVI